MNNFAIFIICFLIHLELLIVPIKKVATHRLEIKLCAERAHDLKFKFQTLVRTGVSKNFE